ncbi:hypothetical protein [Nocardioides sp. GY 10113]|uniref:hypothetical protein n=1 Tax=Nocardioides sp. GY 10113 TaxID=2569761 RepID=UPI001F0D40CC|nr:hypothetical protein [Nocardioides sp. GY 10113]
MGPNGEEISPEEYLDYTTTTAQAGVASVPQAPMVLAPGAAEASEPLGPLDGPPDANGCSDDVPTMPTHAVPQAKGPAAATGGSGSKPQAGSCNLHYRLDGQAPPGRDHYPDIAFATAT